MNSNSNAPLMLITGGSRGIGAATARLAAEGGSDVAFSYASNESAARAIVADVQARGRRALAIDADSADPNQIMKLFTEVDQEFGRIDVLVNNAAIIGRQSRIEDIGFDRIQRIFAVNSIGPMLYAQQAAKRMSSRQQGRGGVIINISSASARLGSPNEYVDYAASKGAIETFTTGFSKEVARERHTHELHSSRAHLHGNACQRRRARENRPGKGYDPHRQRGTTGRSRQGNPVAGKC